MKKSRFLTVMAAACAASACGSGGSGNDGSGNSPNLKPTFIGTVTITNYDGVSDDLLTGGLGKDGLSSATAPVPANLVSPTPAELRRLAIYTNYRAIVDTNTNGGYGSLYGPNVDALGNVTASQGKIAGVEYMAFSDDGSGRQNVTMLVQIPATFDTSKPCLVTATSSGSRGIYGAISTGEWGLKRGCAVAYTDKGTGAAPHDLDTNTVPLIDGTRTTRVQAGNNAQFSVPDAPILVSAFEQRAPHRLAFKHAHSQRNPEKDWGTFTLQAIQFGLWALNDRFGTIANGVRQQTLDSGKVTVIASSVSNGGGAALAAAELDTQGLIDGIAVGEPQVNLPASVNIVVRRGGVPVAASGRVLYDYTTTANLLQLCAAQNASLNQAPLFTTAQTQTGLNRCQSLAARGVVGGATPADQSADALARLHAAGWEADSDALHPSLAAFQTASAISVTYANAYSRASVLDRLCGYSFAHTEAGGTPLAMPPAPLATLFSTGNGIPPAGDVSLINDNNPSGPFVDLLSTSPGTGVQDGNLDGALCLRGLLDGAGPQGQALLAGIVQVTRTGDLRGKPAVIVHGRSDALIPVNHASRPYLGLNSVQEGARSKLSYIEVENAQHFDAFIDVVPGYANRYIPLHVYLNRAIDAVFDNLATGKALPPSQVVRTVPRGGTFNTPAPAIALANVPPLAAAPLAANRITVSGNTVDVPN